jgi:ATPase subunit of ABC transporter with duplicated ATPase domains
MIQTENLTLSFGGQTLFKDVNVKFLDGNCYGLIGPNGAGKSTFLKILSGEIEPTSGSVVVAPGKRIAILKQNQFEFDEFPVLETVLMGHIGLYHVYAERNALYAKPELSNEEGEQVGKLEIMFADMDGYSAEPNAASLLSELGIPEDLHAKKMGELEAGQKIRVLLAQALFGNPDILLLDEPTNQLDYSTVMALEKFLLAFENTVIIVSHDRHFLNKVCTHIADLDFKNIHTYVGNYDFWEKSSQLITQQKQDQHKKTTDKIKELEDFVRRFSANASKSKQATSRKKLIEKLRPDELPQSSRRAPFIQFKPNRPCGDSVLTVKDVSYALNGEPLVTHVSFTLQKGDKVAIVGPNSLSKTTLLRILAGDLSPDTGTVTWGPTITVGYFPKDNSRYFGENKSLLDWLAQYYEKSDPQHIRGLLGRMLFSGDAVMKKTSVLSGGEKARAMFSKLMMAEANALLFDEPTDHLDLESISALNNGLIVFPEMVMVISQDFELLNTVVNRIIEVTPAGMRDYHGTFEDFVGRG